MQGRAGLSDSFIGKVWLRSLQQPRSLLFLPFLKKETQGCKIQRSQKTRTGAFSECAGRESAIRKDWQFHATKRQIRNWIAESPKGQAGLSDKLGHLAREHPIEDLDLDCGCGVEMLIVKRKRDSSFELWHVQWMSVLCVQN